MFGSLQYAPFIWLFLYGVHQTSTTNHLLNNMREFFCLDSNKSIWFESNDRSELFVLVLRENWAKERKTRPARQSECSKICRTFQIEPRYGEILVQFLSHSIQINSLTTIWHFFLMHPHSNEIIVYLCMADDRKLVQIQV